MVIEHIPSNTTELNCTDYLWPIHDEAFDTPGQPELEMDLGVSNDRDNEQWLRIIELVQLSGDYNKNRCKICVNNRWNFELLDALLSNYHDREVLDLLQYGWPVEWDDSVALEMGGY